MMYLNISVLSASGINAVIKNNYCSLLSIYLVINILRRYCYSHHSEKKTKAKLKFHPRSCSLPGKDLGFVSKHSLWRPCQVVSRTTLYLSDGSPSVGRDNLQMDTNDWRHREPKVKETKIAFMMKFPSGYSILKMGSFWGPNECSPQWPYLSFPSPCHLSSQNIMQSSQWPQNIHVECIKGGPSILLTL